MSKGASIHQAVIPSCALRLDRIEDEINGKSGRPGLVQEVESVKMDMAGLKVTMRWQMAATCGCLGLLVAIFVKLFIGA